MKVVESDKQVSKDTRTKKAIYTLCALNYQGDNLTMANGADFTPFDKAVHNAVCSLFEDGTLTFTPSTVYRVMNGLSSEDRVSEQSTQDVINSIEKSRYLKIFIDYTEEAKQRYGDQIKNCVIDAMLLNVKRVNIAVYGAEQSLTTGYKIESKPVLYEYAQLTKQIANISPNVLNTKAATKNTKEVIAIREYLIRRIERMRKPANRTISNWNRILVDSIVKDCRIETAHRTQAARYRKQTEQILDLWTNDNWIGGYNIVLDGQKTKGYDILIDKPTQ